MCEFDWLIKQGILFILRKNKIHLYIIVFKSHRNYLDGGLGLHFNYDIFSDDHEEDTSKSVSLSLKWR